MTQTPGRWFVTGGSGFVGQALIRRLVADGHDVRALARSASSASLLQALGAAPVRGDLGSLDTVTDQLDGVQVVVHLAAETNLGQPADAFRTANVAGTRAVVSACAHAGVRRLVHISTEAVLAEGAPLRQVDESRPLATRPAGIYSATKADAERIVRGAPAELETVILRPRFVWGPGDTTVLPELVAAVRSGRFAWPGGGQQLTSTTHVENLIDAILLVAAHPSARGIYFVADDDPTTFRTFVSELLATQGISAPSRSLPLPIARLIASGSERLWNLLRRSGKPPLTRQELALMFVEVTVNDTRIRTELGYRPRLARQDGLAELAAAAQPDPGQSTAAQLGPLSAGA